METERWQRIEVIFHAAMQCEPADRSPLLQDACADDAALRAEVESLIQYGEISAKFLDKPAMEFLAQALAEDIRATADRNSRTMIGARIAQYRIIDKLGTGGMGDVYRAVRADDQFEMQVAIKLVRQGLDRESVEARFRRERQILAGFEHENIARLLDGGTTEDGHPYFVMELVEGKPIDEYCDSARLGTTARLDLFRKVCSAVQYAHQRLVVHRDIKPSNILVTAEGVPKLLDFGIATILSTEPVFPDSERTETGLRMMTPQFASPEQLHGQLITTATDIYSLGVVLYKLLTGRMPYRLDSKSPYDLAQAICETTPEKPSSAIIRSGSFLSGPITNGSIRAHLAEAELASSCRSSTPERLRRTLSGDLDQIILKALRKEPERRYASARDFAEDLLSYLRGLPVSARRGTFAYRSAKFIRRNRIVLAVTSVFALLGLIGLVVIVREARIARIHQARAEQRFNDLRSLANSLLFEIHDSIVDLPGSTAARKLLVDRALHYFDSLSHESAGSPGLQRELATAYERVGDVQGNPYFANLGDTGGAIESYRKALKIRLQLADGGHSYYEDRAALVGAYMKLGLGLEAASNFSASLHALQEAYPIAKALAEEQPDNPQAAESLAGVCFQLATTQADMGDVASSLDYFRRSAAIREAITSGSPEFQKQLQTRLSGVYGYMAGDLALQGDLDGAIALEHKAHDILARLAASDPKSARLQQFLHESEFWSGFYIAQKGLQSQALPYFRTALAGYLKLTKSDAHDVLAMRYVGKCYMAIGSALAATGKPEQGIKTARRAIEIFDALAAADKADNFFKPVDLAYARSTLADAYEHLALTSGISGASKLENWSAARFWYQQSLGTWVHIEKTAPLGNSDAAQPGRIQHEIAVCDAAIASASHVTPQP
jgi:eukaryotic-like serine/threonine-protein kinase